jgi:hypothetical protein
MWTAAILGSFGSLAALFAALTLHRSLGGTDISLSSLVRNGLKKTTLAVSAFGALLALFWLLSQSTSMRDLSAAILLSAFGFTTWIYLLDPRDKQFVISTAAYYRTRHQGTSARPLV